MLEHYHMSFLLNYRKTVISFYIQSCSRTKSCRRQTAFGLILRTLSFKDSMTLLLFISNTLIPGCGISGYDWTGTCLLRQFTNLPCFLLCSFSFFVVIGGRWKPQDTLYYRHVSIARLSIKDLSFPLLLRFERKHNTEDTTHLTHTFTFLPTFS